MGFFLHDFFLKQLWSLKVWWRTCHFGILKFRWRCGENNITFSFGPNNIYLFVVGVFLHHNQSSLPITSGPSSSSELGKWINMKFLFLNSKCIHIMSLFLRMTGTTEWLKWCLSKILFFSFWLCNSFCPCLVTNTSRGLLEPNFHCTFYKTLYITASYSRLQIYFKSIWFDNEGLTLCVERDLKQTYCNFLFWF